VRHLLASGAKANSRDRDGWTPLFYAARHGNQESVGELLNHGADPNVQAFHKPDQPPNPNRHRAFFGTTALHQAIKADQLDVVKLLLAHGAKTDLFCYGGFAALHIAAFLGRLQIVKALLESGADRGLKCRSVREPHSVGEALARESTAFTIALVRSNFEVAAAIKSHQLGWLRQSGQSTQDLIAVGKDGKKLDKTLTYTQPQKNAMTRELLLMTSLSCAAVYLMRKMSKK